MTTPENTIDPVHPRTPDQPTHRAGTSKVAPDPRSTNASPSGAVDGDAPGPPRAAGSLDDLWAPVTVPFRVPGYFASYLRRVDEAEQGAEQGAQQSTVAEVLPEAG